jgi:hypothetical protein
MLECCVDCVRNDSNYTCNRMLNPQMKIALRLSLYDSHFILLESLKVSVVIVMLPI